MSLKQIPLWKQPIKVKISLKEDHELVRLEKLIDWDELILLAMNIREKKKKANTGPVTHFRELLGAVVLMSIKKITYRDAEDLITHYAPARYLCNLMDSSWTIDHVTLFEFIKILGPEGMEKINKYAINLAVKNGLADPILMVSDTTAQEAKIPYPNEIGLMGRYISMVKKLVRKAGSKFKPVKEKIKEVHRKIKALIKTSHIFAKTPEKKKNVAKKMLRITDSVHDMLHKAIQEGRSPRSKTSKELSRITEIMEELLPQILFFIETGTVAAKKIIHLKMTKLYSIVRGKSGKRVEFGLKWGINRIKGGFISGFLADGLKHLSDKKFSIEAIGQHIEQFGIAPETYGFDRGGYSSRNIKKASKLGVKHVGIAPTGKKEWAVSKIMQKKIKSERAQIEGAIGTIKNPIYGFNRPDAKSTEAMVTYGHRAFLGFNLRKMLREMKKLELQTT